MDSRVSEIVSASNWIPNPLLSIKSFTTAVVIDQPTANKITINAKFIKADDNDSFCHFLVKMTRMNIRCAVKINAEII